MANVLDGPEMSDILQLVVSREMSLWPRKESKTLESNLTTS